MNLPNKLTVLRIFMIPLFIVIMMNPWNWGDIQIGSAIIPANHFWAALVFVIASITDYLDGYLARRWKLVTNFGAFADPVADKMLVMTALIMLVEAETISGWIVAIITARELAVTGLRLIIVENKGQVVSAAWPGKIKTVTQMLAITFLLLHNLPLHEASFSIGHVLLDISLFFTIYSGVEYFWNARDVFKDSM